MFKKNQILKDIKIIDYTYEGLGIAKVDNFAIFVTYGKLDETYDLKITKIEKSYAYAMIISENELQYSCPHFKVCGGCQIQHLTYEEQLDFKYKTVSNLANKYEIDTTINQVEKNDSPYAYRNKVQMPFTKDSEGNIKAGFFKKRSHDVIDIDYCYLQSELVNNIVDDVCQLLSDIGETVYNEDTGRGNLRHLYIRESQNTKQIMLTLVCNSESIKNDKYFVSEITKKYKDISSIVINVNTRRTNAVLGFKNLNLYNCNFINESLGDINYRISPNVFFQVNTNQAVKMYDLIKEYSELDGTQNVLDAYCGTGSIALYLAKNANSVTGIEIVAPSIASANSNMKANNITNTNFICGDCKDEIAKLKTNEFDVIVVDPPRKGLDKNFVEVLNNSKCKRIVYVSCNPDSLMRDLAILSDKYEVEQITPVDMFSQTYHVECVCKLNLKEN